MREKKNKNAPGSKQGLRHLEMEAVNASSSGDCTGLIPSAPKSQDEREAYKDLREYSVEPRR